MFIHQHGIRENFHTNLDHSIIHEVIKALLMKPDIWIERSMGNMLVISNGFVLQDCWFIRLQKKVKTVQKTTILK